jgi:acetyltransferase-like isoleucine patch superfamily enzyme
MIEKFFHYAFHWIRCRLICQLKIIHLSNVKVEGRVSLSFNSILFISKDSKILIGSKVRIQSSIVRIKKSEFDIGSNAKISHSRIMVNDSRLEIGMGCIFKQVMFHVKDKSECFIGKHFQLTKHSDHPAYFYASSSSIQIGENVNLFAQLVCESAILEMGNNIFINSGTQLRCMKKITLGSNILVSYDCIIFDTNTHSLDPSDRRKELQDGYPNQAIQSADVKQKVKTAPIHIGNDIWIGTRALIFKGTKLGDEVIVGACTVLSGIEVPHGKIVTGNPGKWN